MAKSTKSTTPELPPRATPVPTSGGSYVVEGGELKKTAGTEPAEIPAPQAPAANQE